MRILRLKGPLSSPVGMPGIADLIDKIGSPAFPSALFRSTFGWAAADHLTAFVFEPGHEPHMIFAENTGNRPVAREVAHKYCRDYWQHDLAHRLSSEIDLAEARQGWILHSQASDISHSDYRRYCYTAISLDNRVSLSDTRGDRTLRINFYRAKGTPFTEDDTSRIAEAAHLMLSLVRRHADYCVVAKQKSLSYFRERLAIVAPALTSRETDVCAAIIMGLTSEGIALELGVGLNTVFTYKKRAYARLGISSQNQLMRLVLN